METTVSLGRVAGIRVGVHWSVLAIWWLLTWSLATRLLPDAATGEGRGVYWVTAGLAAVVLLGCLLGHELSHAIVARRHGIGTEAITLWVFGGVAQLRDESPSPKTEALVAAAGPAASFGFAAAAVVLQGAFASLGAPEVVVAAIGWLALVNVVLAVFNLLPGFPLDGGRVLHAWLWSRSGDRLGATRRAARIGRAFGYGLIAVGVLEFTAGYWAGLWFVFLGWFLTSAASSEATMSGVRDALAGVTVGDVMTANPDTAPDWITVRDLLDDFVMQRRHSTFPLRDQAGRITGLATLAAIKRVPPSRRASTPASAVAIPFDDVLTVRATDALVEVLGQLVGAARGRALVLDRHGAVVGILTPSDVARVLDFASLASAG